MRVELQGEVRVQIGPVDGRMVTRIFVGEREIPASPLLAQAVGMFCAGAKDPKVVELLLEHGILKKTETTPHRLEGSCFLSPQAALNIRLFPRGKGRQTVLPTNSFPISLFVPPEVLSPIQKLDSTLKKAWGQMIRASHSREGATDYEGAAEVLRALALEIYDGSDALQAVVRWNEEDGGYFEPSQPLQVPEVQYPIATVTCVADRKDQIAQKMPQALIHLFSAKDRLRSLKEMRAFSTLLGRLTRGTTVAEVEAFLNATQSRNLLTWWTESVRGGLVQSGSPTPAYESLGPGTIAHLGHATLLANLGNDFILIDPWFCPGSKEDAIAPPSIGDLPRLSAVFFTHHHWDHVNIETLLKLDKDTPLYIPAQSSDPVLVPKTRDLLQYLGFSHVLELEHGESVDFGEDGRVVAAPFYGEDPTGLEYVGNTYVVQYQDKAAYVHVDSGPDVNGKSTISTGLGASLVQQYGPLNPVFATRRQERGTMVEHTWEYLFTPSDRWVRPTENCCNDSKFLASLTEGLGSKHLVLYSEGGADWYPTGTDFLRGSAHTVTNDVYEFMWDSRDKIDQAVKQVGAKTYYSDPRDCWIIGGGQTED